MVEVWVCWREWRDGRVSGGGAGALVEGGPGVGGGEGRQLLLWRRRIALFCFENYQHRTG